VSELQPGEKQNYAQYVIEREIERERASLKRDEEAQARRRADFEKEDSAMTSRLDAARAALADLELALLRLGAGNER